MFSIEDHHQLTPFCARFASRLLRALDAGLHWPG
jgi:hypothetical protein